MKKTTLYGIVVFLVIFFSATHALADDQFQVEKVFTVLTPIYMTGHDGDFNWIEGFDFLGEIYLGGNQVGTFSGQGTLFNPPVNFAERYDGGIVRFTNTITGLGTFEMIGEILTLGTSGSAATGIVTFAWQGSLSNGTGNYADIVGLSTGIGSFNIFTTQGAGTEYLLFRFGY
jgi:hypothetical protein